MIHVVETSVRMNLQPLKPDEIKALSFDVRLRYVRIFSLVELFFNDFVIHNNIKYRIVNPVPYEDYGYWEAYGEEVKDG